MDETGADRRWRLALLAVLGKSLGGKSIIARAWLAFGGLIFILVVGTVILHSSMNSVDGDITRITDVEEAITGAAYEMEINVIGTGMGVLEYLDAPDRVFRARVTKDEADFERFQAEFDRLASTPEERELATEIAGLYDEYKALGVRLMDQKDIQEELFRTVGVNFADIDRIIDEELQPIIDTATFVGLEQSVHAVEMELNAAEVSAWLGNYLRVGSEEYRTRISDDTADFWKALSLFREQGTTAAEESVLLDVESIFGGASELTDDVLVVHDGIQTQVGRFVDLREQLDALLDEKIQLLTEEALIASRADAHASVDWMQWMIRVMTGVSVLAGGLAMVFLIRGILDPVQRLAEGAEEIGQGNLGYRIEVRRDDELGAVSNAFNLMAARRQDATNRTEEIIAARTGELRASEANHRALLEAIPDSILRIDSNGAVLDARVAPESVFANLDLRAISDALPPEVVADAHDGITRALATRTAQAFEYHVSSNGDQRDFEARLVPIGDGEELVMIDREITARKEADRQLTELVRSKNSFLATVSHELRTPLTAVLGFAEFLVGSEPEVEEAERQDMIRSIAQQASDVAAIVEDLLVVARSEIGEVHVVQKSVRFQSQLAQVVEGLDPRPSLEILDSEAVTAVGDPARVRQIIRNVISNAVRYGGDRLRADIGASDSIAFLRFSDDGEGLPPDMWERVFEPYARAHNRDGQPAAVGIGLTVSRDLARLMRGDLTYSHVDGWSRFELTLPVA